MRLIKIVKINNYIDFVNLKSDKIIDIFNSFNK
jgi:hypothetical protein